jgi:uncharacterized membrane protein YdbT with pleckstrin-like domain
MPPMGYPKRLLTDDEEIIREFRPHWRLLVIPLFWSLLAIAAIIIFWTWLNPDWEAFDLPIVPLLVTILGVALIVWLAVRPFVNWYFTMYVLTTERLIKRWGVISRNGIEIPLENVTDVQFSQNILERMLRSGDVLIQSAGELGQSHFQDIPDPEHFQSQIYRAREARTNALARATGIDPAAQLETLTRLHRDGALTDEEYEERRQRLLDQL